MDGFKEYRNFLKDTIRKTIDFRSSAQNRGVPVPPLQEPVDSQLPRIGLPGREAWSIAVRQTDLTEAIGNRRSRRKFSEKVLKIEELAFLLWATQGQRKPGKQAPFFRTVPSAGARHSFETYLFIYRVETIPPGLYRYLPLTDELVLIYPADDQSKSELSRALLGQKFVADSAVVFVWTTVPRRMEWRYLQAAHRVILLDAGHVCQNLYLACEAIQAGTCAIAAYDQEVLDELIRVDGEEQFTVYLAPVGKY
ncbi:MAG: SagB/ThcOx family dehydrogenase [Deltaproteobacteria bacterium]|nr:SagB/ThcOx family dehydrogenase [Deltaproteobacteria bacterium]